MRKTIVLVSGKAGVGKTTFANKLAKLSDGEVLHFATGVKKIADECFGWDGGKDERGRKLLQNIGQIGRAYNEDIWVEETLHEIQHVILANVFIIDDWRFPNELEYINNRATGCGVYTVRIEARNREILKDNPELYNEVSETSLPSWSFGGIYDFLVDNSLGLSELDKQVFTIHNNIFGGL